MTNKQIILNEQDFIRLTLLMNQLKTTRRFNNRFITVLANEIKSAHIGDVNHYVPKHVTLNSKVIYKDLRNETIFKASIVFPAFADSTKDLYSILSPLGTALIGEEVGNITTCYAPGGEIKLKILEVEHSTHGVK